MTRINLIPPQYLADQHLVAEHKEILQLCGSYRLSKRSKKGINRKDIPKNFTLNAGHVKFFYDKFAYLHKRFLEIQNEMRHRKIIPTKRMNCEEFEIDGVYHNWEPNNDDIEIVCERIQQKINMKPEWYKYKGDLYINTEAYNKFQTRQF